MRVNTFPDGTVVITFYNREGFAVQTLDFTSMEKANIFRDRNIVELTQHGEKMSLPYHY